MALILNIDTALSNASICIANDDVSLAYTENETKEKHAGWIHDAITNMLQVANVALGDLDAVAVSNGPGSYTGLRISLATAKGLCYALNIPLICISTLEVMAHAVKDDAWDLICPMIDARRMEVFTAVYDKELKTIKTAEALILSETSFADILTNHKVLFTGDGMLKFKHLATSPNAVFQAVNTNALSMLPLSAPKYHKSDFADLAYAEPFYVKAVHTV